MKRNVIFSAGVFALFLCSTEPAYTQNNTRDEPVPIAPIAPIDYEGWTNAYRLRNDVLEVVVIPEIGRIAHLGFRGEQNVLRLDETLHGQPARSEEAEDEWRNFGGDWIWPVAQNHWPDFQDGDWPPSRILDGVPWTGRAWRTEDESQYALFSRDYGEPLHIRVTRTIRLDPTNSSISVRQRIERADASTIPVTLWHLSQIKEPDHVVIPIEEDSRFPDGIALLKFDPPEPGVLKYCGNTLVYDAQRGDEHKLGSDSPRAWMAAQAGDILIVARAQSNITEGEYPEGGCTLQMYANRGLGYIELETLSVERDLDVDDYIDNTLHLSLHRLDPVPDSRCALAEQVQSILDEDPEPSAEIDDVEQDKGSSEPETEP